ncbi:ATP-dependent DNA/RNA helicase [Oleoguttula sp. CCFEE 5521]
MKRKLNADDVPEPVASDVVTATVSINTGFASLGLDARLLQAIAKEKLTAPTPVQVQAIPLAIAGKDILARAKTGSGKTLAYLLPIIHSILRRKASSSRPTKAVSAIILVPTKELAAQVTTAVKTFTSFCNEDIRAENINRKEDLAVTRARLLECPEIVIGTPNRVSQWISNDVLKAADLVHVVIDEADLVLSYEYEDELRSIAASLPAGVQNIFMSATLRTEVDKLTALFCKSGSPVVLDLSEQEAAEKPILSQYIVKTAEDEKFLLTYAIFKLQLIKGKIIIFVADIDRCYRMKLFLEQFGTRSCVLNSELPVNSRLHVVEEFNKGVYDVLIAADEREVAESGKRKIKRNEDDDMEDVDEMVAEDVKDDKDETANAAKITVQSLAKRQRKTGNDREFGVSRGIDFRHVACVLNFDLPTSSKSYTHRIGRTARAGQKGMALSFYVPTELFRKHRPTSIPQCQYDEKVLARITAHQERHGAKLEEWQFDMDKLSGFRYRLTDALRAVTRVAIREARTKELRQELINSTKLARHFEEHPEDLRHLRHDTESHAVRLQPHLKHVPEYLLPSGGKAAVQQDVGFVGFRKDERAGNKIRKAREVNRKRGKGAIMKGKRAAGDPLKSLNARGRGKK